MKLNLGCGDIILEGYKNCDLFNENADVHCDAKVLPFDDNSADEILTQHLIEHFDFKEIWDVLKEWKRVLRPGGTLIIETPDFLESCRLFPTLPENDRIKMYPHFFASPWIRGLGHKFLFTPTQIVWTLEQSGFKDIRRTQPIRYVENGFPHMRWECTK